MNQMTDDVERAPGVFPFISERPYFRQVTQKRIEDSGRAGEERYCVLQVVSHRGPFAYGVSKTFPAVMLDAYCCRARAASSRGTFACKSVLRSLPSRDWTWRARRS